MLAGSTPAVVHAHVPIFINQERRRCEAGKVTAGMAERNCSYCRLYASDTGDRHWPLLCLRQWVYLCIIDGFPISLSHFHISRLLY